MEERFFTPPPEHELQGERRLEAAQLVDVAERAVADAQYTFRGRTGDYFLHLEDAVEVVSDPDTAPDSLAVTRHIPWTDDTYEVTNGDKLSYTTIIEPDGSTVVSAGTAPIRAAAAAVDVGRVLGAHRTIAVKELVLGEDTGVVTLFVGVTRTNDGRLSPTTTIDLNLVRSYDAEGSTLVQSCRIHSDPNTGTLHTADALSGQEGIQTQGEVAGATSYVDSPFAELTAAELQAEATVGTPLDRALTASEWAQLITQPINPTDAVPIH